MRREKKSQGRIEAKQTVNTADGISRVEVPTRMNTTTD